MATDKLAADEGDSAVAALPSGDDQGVHAQPAVEVEYQGIEPARARAITESGTRLLQAILKPSDSDCFWTLKDSIWPTLLLREYRDIVPAKARLVLMPLNRIGRMEGKSGSLVLIGYLAAAENREIPKSHPLVVKTMPKGEADKLGDEYRNAESIKPFAYNQKDVFAIPFRFDDRHPDYHVLWSIFLASESLWPDGGQEPNLHVRDVRDLISDDDNDSVKYVLGRTFESLRNLHKPIGRNRHERRVMGKEYDWYQRGYRGLWGEEWTAVWGPSDQKNVQIDGQEHANPLWVVERLGDMEADLTVGAVHGDLHLGNIVLSAAGDPQVIDFGWSQDQSHIAKDFVLLECNLRFLALPPQLSVEVVRSFANWIAWDAPVPLDIGDYCGERIKLIQYLREQARQVFPLDTDWTREYLVPLFLVAFGLLRFAPQLGNQLAATLTILSLADHIARFLEGDEESARSIC